MELSPKVTGNLEKYLKEDLGKDIFFSMHRETYYKIETHYKRLILYGKVEGGHLARALN